ncbi:hypothetical protein LZ31DRAFT_202474 [Colletotrichum somersetense]|nr:hypothetical protein LZ31DRAFT_202474 [Colletotrichum somersetense]
MLVLACLTPAPDPRGLASISGTGKRGGNYTDAGQQGRLDQSSSPLFTVCRVVTFFRIIRMPFTGPLPPSTHDLTPQKGSPRHGEPAFAGCVWGIYAYLQSLFSALRSALSCPPFLLFLLLFSYPISGDLNRPVGTPFPTQAEVPLNPRRVWGVGRGFIESSLFHLFFFNFFFFTGCAGHCHVSLIRCCLRHPATVTSPPWHIEGCAGIYGLRTSFCMEWHNGLKYLGRIFLLFSSHIWNRRGGIWRIQYSPFSQRKSHYLHAQIYIHTYI